MENKDNKAKESGGLYSRVNMSLKTADIIITVLVVALVIVVAFAINM